MCRRETFQQRCKHKGIVLTYGGRVWNSSWWHIAERWHWSCMCTESLEEDVHIGAQIDGMQCPIVCGICMHIWWCSGVFVLHYVPGITEPVSHHRTYLLHLLHAHISCPSHHLDNTYVTLIVKVTIWCRDTCMPAQVLYIDILREAEMSHPPMVYYIIVIEMYLQLARGLCSRINCIALK